MSPKLTHALAIFSCARTSLRCRKFSYRAKLAAPNLHFRVCFSGGLKADILKWDLNCNCCAICTRHVDSHCPFSKAIPQGKHRLNREASYRRHSALTNAILRCSGSMYWFRAPPVSELILSKPTPTLESCADLKCTIPFKIIARMNYHLRIFRGLQLQLSGVCQSNLHLS